MSSTLADVIVATLKAWASQPHLRHSGRLAERASPTRSVATARSPGSTSATRRRRRSPPPGEAAVTGRLAVCAASCGPGNLHLINGLFDAHRSRRAGARDRGPHPAEEIGGGYFQETHPQELFRECSVYAELVSVPEQLPRILEIAMRSALERGGVAVVVVPGELFLARAPGRCRAPGDQRRPPRSCGPATRRCTAAAEVLNDASRVTILAGAGCQGAHDEVVAARRASCRRRSSMRCGARSSSSTTTRTTSG